MNTAETNGTYSRALNEMLLLRYEPVAVKMIEDEALVPGHALRPRRDLKQHMALCQAFALTRRDRKTVYLDKHSHWCWNPLIGLGLVDCPEGSEAFELVCRYLGMASLEEARAFFAKFPRLPYGKYQGILTAPLCGCAFEPDLVMIYAGNAQLRSMVWAVKRETGRLLETQLDAIDSCVWALVPPMLTGDYRVTLPDVGEYERAMAEEWEIIFSVPGPRLGELVRGLRFFHDRGMGYAHHARDMALDFKRPPFYNELFALWGLDQGEDWDK